MNKELVLTERQEKLLELVKGWHGTQVRKYTNEPYWTHPLAVAKLVHPHAPGYLSVEAALCHDLFEDTECGATELFHYLMHVGYTNYESVQILRTTVELTDVFTHEAFPELNRQTRKANEAIRLGKISDVAQNVKFADLIDNTSSIVAHDKGFARVYIKEKEHILEHMKGGNPIIRNQCLLSLESAIKELAK